MNLRDRKSKWTRIYCDTANDENGGHLFYYVRIVPDFMDTERAGSSHGFAIGGGRFYFDGPKEEAWNSAVKLADCIDKFFDAMLVDLAETEAELTEDTTTEESILQNAIEKHQLEKLKEADLYSVRALIRYAKHIGYNLGQMDMIRESMKRLEKERAEWQVKLAKREKNLRIQFVVASTLGLLTAAAILYLKLK